MATPDNTIFHVGYCRDIKKAIKFYSDFPSLHTNWVEKLVYFEQYEGADAEDMARERFEELTKFPWDLKAAVIGNINPEFIELIPGINVEI